MRLRILILILFVIIFSKCNYDNSPSFMAKIPNEIKFTSTYNIEGEKFLDEQIGVDNLHIFDTIMFLSTPSKDSLFQIHSINSRKKITNLVKKGEGPNELNQVLKPLNFAKKKTTNY